MSILHLPQLLKLEELAEIDHLLENSLFIDGSKTASLSAQSVKNNLQIDLISIFKCRHILFSTAIEKSALSWHKSGKSCLILQTTYLPNYATREDDDDEISSSS
jgi:predicted 2-oxoglutarate/Fe(II)-dependent dioxygenase YbiX